MATKIGVFNGACQALGHRRLVDTGEEVTAARELSFCYDQVLGECLDAGSWNFATETVKIEADTGIAPAFGFTEVFAKPPDWVRTVGVSLDERFSFPLLQYYDDASFWSADSTPLYVRYVSDDTGLGFELNRWTPNFTRFVELSLAERTCLPITQSEAALERIKKDLKTARLTALNHDAMNEAAVKFPVMGSWNASRGSSMGRRDRGSRGSLIG